MRDDTTQELPPEEQPAATAAMAARAAPGVEAGTTGDAADTAGTGELAAEEPAAGVLTLVCFKCGKEYFFDDEEPPAEMTCEKCGNTVFRSFFSPVGDEVADDFRDSTERDLATDSPSTDTAPGDLIDLDNL